MIFNASDVTALDILFCGTDVTNKYQIWKNKGTYNKKCQIFYKIWDFKEPKSRLSKDSENSCLGECLTCK